MTYRFETIHPFLDGNGRVGRLQQEVGERMRTLGSRAANAGKVIEHLYQRPLIDAAKVGEVAEISPPSAYKLIADMERLEILREITGARRGRLYLFDESMNLFRS